jgi:transposase
MREIGRRLGLSRWAVRHYIDAHAFPEQRRKGRQSSMLDPFAPYLRRRWAEGCRNGMQLWRELRAQGYPGSRKRVAQGVQQRRLEPAPTTPGPWRQAVAERAAAGSHPRATSTRQ